jgi:hypothetical protein
VPRFCCIDFGVFLFCFSRCGNTVQALFSYSWLDISCVCACGDVTLCVCVCVCGGEVGTLILVIQTRIK